MEQNPGIFWEGFPKLVADAWNSMQEAKDVGESNQEKEGRDREKKGDPTLPSLQHPP